MGSEVLQGGTLSDVDMAWRRKQIYVTPHMMNAILDDITDGQAEAAATATVINVEVAALGIAGFRMNTDADIMQGGFPIPYDLDPAYEIGFKVVFTADVSGADSILWTINYKRIGEGVIYSAPTQVLDTIIADKSTASADSLHLVTSRGIALAGTHVLTRAMIDANDWLMLEIVMTTKTGAPTDTIFLGLLMDYAVHPCAGTGTAIDQPLGGN